jgi:hypothetical protein
MLSLLLAAALLQGSPDAAPAEAPAETGLPKTDYELVAWCHGALAGQLELEPRARAAMVTVEGKAKVAARAKEDAEMEKARRQYLKDYEHALAAAEAASPTPIHRKGVDAELHGYALWTATRNKDPLWLMLDWGMWDPNDIGCSEAAKRLYSRSKLFGEALKESAGGESVADASGPPSAKFELKGSLPADGDVDSAAPDRRKGPAPEELKNDTPTAEPQTDPKPAEPPAMPPSLRGRR